MKCAVIAPTKLLGLTTYRDYHMILPQLLGNEEYFKFFAQVKGHKILDNGEAEGVFTAPLKLFQAADVVQADEIVVPDVMGDCFQTIERVKTFKRFARAHPEFTYMGVAQGKTFQEVLQCLTVLSLEDWISVLALPRILVNTISLQARCYILGTYKRIIADGFEAVHCLGMGRWIEEPRALTGFSSVRGIDTSLPFSMAFAGKDIHTDQYEPRQKGYFDIDIGYEGDEWDLLMGNLETLFRWCEED